MRRIDFDAFEIMLLAVIALFVLRCTAHGDPVHLQSESTCTTAKGSTVALPPGYFADEAAYAALDLELRRAQDSETRLAAENKSLREQAPTWVPGWKTVLGAALLGMASVLAIERL
jgi:hypothetical protein